MVKIIEACSLRDHVPEMLLEGFSFSHPGDHKGWVQLFAITFLIRVLADQHDAVFMPFGYRYHKQNYENPRQTPYNNEAMLETFETM